MGNINKTLLQSSYENKEKKTQYRLFGSKGKGKGQFSRPYDIVSNQKNQTIMVSDHYNHRIQIFNRQGDYLSQFGSQGSNNGQFQWPSQLSLHPAANNTPYSSTHTP